MSETTYRSEPGADDAALLLRSASDLAYCAPVIDQHLLISVTDTQGRILHANARFCALSGYSAAALMGKNHRIVKSDVHEAAFFEAMWSTIASGNVWRGVICNRAKDGRLYWVNSTIRPLLGPDGLPRRYVSIRDDVTSLYEAKAELAERESRLLALSQLGSDWYWQQDEELRFLPMTATVCAVTGIAEASFAGRRRWELPWAGISEAAMANHRKALERRDSFVGFRYAIRRPDGRNRWMCTSGMPLYDQRGKFIGYHGVARDVTRDREMQARLEQGKERLRLALGATDISLWDWSMRENVIYLDERWEEMKGGPHWPSKFTPEQLLTQTHPDDRLQVAAAAQAMLRGECKRYESVHRVLHNDGRWIWIRSQGEVVERDEAGYVTRCAGSNVDITREKTLELALIESKARAEQLAVEDSLTGIANRRGFDQHLERELRRCRRSGESVAVILIDVDHFKQYNDIYGHPAGDRALVQIAAAIARCARRAGDMAARYGGEEFALVLPAITLDAAAAVAAIVQAEVVRLSIPHAGSDVASWVTISSGLAMTSKQAQEASSVLAAADQALYLAKAQGRNRVAIAPSRSTTAQSS